MEIATMMENGVNGQLDKLFDEWITKYNEGLFSKDGLLIKPAAYENEKSVEARWQDAHRKVMFFLKDQNGHLENYQVQSPVVFGDDIRTWLSGEGNNYDKNRQIKGQFFKNIAKIFFGLCSCSQNKWCGFADEFEKIPSQQLQKKLLENFLSQPFAFVEAKKIIGGPWLQNRELEFFLENDKKYLCKEIDILRPNIIVCCGKPQFDFVIENYFSKDVNDVEKKSFPYEYDGVVHFNCEYIYDKKKKILAISTYHPSKMFTSSWKIYECTINSFRDFLKTHPEF